MNTEINFDDLPWPDEHDQQHPASPSADPVCQRRYVLNPHESGAWICSDCLQLVRPWNS